MGQAGILATTLALAVTLWWSPCRAEERDGTAVSLERADLFNRAGGLFQEEDYAGVLELLRGEVEAVAAPHPYACILFGAACMRLDDNTGAIRAFEKGIASAPDHAGLHLNLAVALSQEERFHEAGDRFLTVAGLDPEQAPRHVQAAAQCYYHGQDYALSLETLLRIADDGTDRVDWCLLAAADCMQLSRWDEAEGYLERVSRLEPEERMHWKRLGYVRMRQEKQREALAAMDIAARLPGTTEAERRQLSGLYRRLPAPILGLEIEKLLPEERERDDVVIGSLLRANRLEQVNRYIDGMPEEEVTADLWLISGVAWYRLGKLEEAQAAFHRGADGDGDEAARCRMLEGLTAWERRDWPGAKEAFAALADGEGQFSNQAMLSLRSIESLEAAALELAEMGAP